MNSIRTVNRPNRKYTEILLETKIGTSLNTQQQRYPLFPNIAYSVCVQFLLVCNSIPSQCVMIGHYKLINYYVLSLSTHVRRE